MQAVSKRTPINGPKQANEGFPNVSEAIVKTSDRIIYLKY